MNINTKKPIMNNIPNPNKIDNSQSSGGGGGINNQTKNSKSNKSFGAVTNSDQINSNNFLGGQANKAVDRVVGLSIQHCELNSLTSLPSGKKDFLRF